MLSRFARSYIYRSFAGDQTTQTELVQLPFVASARDLVLFGEAVTIPNATISNAVIRHFICYYKVVFGLVRVLRGVDILLPVISKPFGTADYVQSSQATNGTIVQAIHCRT